MKNFWCWKNLRSWFSEEVLVLKTWDPCFLKKFWCWKLEIVVLWRSFGVENLKLSLSFVPAAISPQRFKGLEMFCNWCNISNCGLGVISQEICNRFNQCIQIIQINQVNQVKLSSNSSVLEKNSWLTLTSLWIF